MKIKAEHLDVFYGQKQILFDITESFKEGEITAVVGQSGCGKSTLLKSLNRIVEEDGGKITGKIFLGERNIFDMDKEELRQHIGLVFQQPLAFPYSIEKNLSYVLNYHHKLSKKDCYERVIHYLQKVKLYDEVKDMLHIPAKLLSGGQKQRLAIARSLCVEPSVLLLDEPCSALDIKNTMAIEEMLMELKQSYTIIIVTHNLAQTQRIADRIVFMHQGQRIESASKDNFFTNPQTELAQAYVKYV